MRDHRLIRGALALLAAVVVTGCGQQSTAQPSSEPAPTEVGVVTVSTQSVTLTSELPGRTRPHQVAEVRPQVTGILEERLFQEGEMVEAGEPLYRIDDQLYKAELASARANLASAEATLEQARLEAQRYERLIQQQAVSQQELDQARATLQESKAQVAARKAALHTARINLDYTTIEAPITGRIGRSAVTPGALVTANQSQSLVTIRQLDPIYVDLTQSYQDLQAFRNALDNGQLNPDGDGRVSVSLVRENGEPYTHDGSLQFSEFAVEESTGSVTLRALFPNPDNRLLPGMFVRGSLPQAERNNAILVPQKGVSRNPNGEATALIVTEDNTVAQRKITTGKAVGSQWLVTDGLSAGDRLIVEGLQKVRPGAPVKAVSVDSSQQAASSGTATNTQG